MKILCSNCGLRYDPAASEGVCPYCGRYNEAPPEAYVPEAAQPAPEEEEVLWTPPAPARRRTSRTALVLFLLFLAVFGAECVIFPLVTGAAKAGQSKASYVPAAAVTSAAQNEAFGFGPAGRQVLVGAAEILGEVRGVEQGSELVRVWCEVDKEQDYRSDWASDAYLQAGDVWYPAVQTYDLEQFYPELAAEALDPYALQGYSMDEGWLYFLIPQGAGECTLWLQCQSLDRDYDISEVAMTGIALTVEEGSVSGE